MEASGRGVFFALDHEPGAPPIIFYGFPAFNGLTSPTVPPYFYATVEIQP
jgi:hypothetical protein